MYYVGVDGSGVYARLIAMDENFKKVGRHSGASVNLAANSRDAVKENLKKLLYEFNRLTNTKPEDCCGICIGVPDGNTPIVVDSYENIYEEIAYGAPIKITSDIELILAAATREGFGTVIVSGVEAAGYALDRHKQIFKIGGWGHLFCDGGSGYAIGMQAIKCALMAAEGLIEKTTLEKKVAEYFGVNTVHDVIGSIDMDRYNRAKIAELSLVVKYASVKNDLCAKMIEEQAASDLALIAKTLIERHGLSEGKVVISGSTISLNENIKSHFTKTLTAQFPDVEVIIQTEKSEVGAVYLMSEN